MPSHAWPAEDSILAADRVDVVLGGAILLVGAGILLLVAGAGAAGLVVLTWLLFALVLGMLGWSRGRRGAGLLLFSFRLATGFVGRWFTP